MGVYRGERRGDVLGSGREQRGGRGSGGGSVCGVDDRAALEVGCGKTLEKGTVRAPGWRFSSGEGVMRFCRQVVKLSDRTWAS